ncbi:MAG: tetratricopeptide repeat protein [Bacteroidales bacterium]|jgi:tetratricopeptide (TPR) repeat protein
MIKGKSPITYIAGAIFILVIILLLAKVIIGNTYRKQIPSLPDLISLSAPLKEQLLAAYKKTERNPSADNIGMMGMVYHSSTYYDKAVVCYKLAIKKDRKNWIWSYYLGYLNRELGDPNTALRNFTEVTKINPKIFLARYYEGECYQKMGLNDSAEIAFKSIINRMDKNAVMRTSSRYDYFPLVTYSMYELARIYMTTEHADIAEKTLMEIIDYQKAFGPAYRLLGNVYSIKGDEPLSKRYLVRANDLTINPSPVDTLIDRLSLISRSEMYLLKKIDEAEKNVFPEYAMVLVNHSLTYIPENNYLIAKAIQLFLISDMGKKALPLLDRHINYFQNDFDELKKVGDLLYQKAFYSQAMKYYSKAIKLKQADSQVQSCMVICYTKEGKKQQALDLVNEKLDKNKTNPDALADGVTLLLNMGEKEKAISWLNKLMRISPSNTKGQKLKGMVLEQDGKLQEALYMYNLSFNGDPADLTTSRLFGNLLVRQKMWDKAISIFRKALEYHPNEPFLLERLGTLLVTCNDPKLRNIAEGRDFCERAFIHTASHSVTLISAGRSLAIAYAILGDKRNASNVIKMTINFARRENVPSSYLDDLRNLLQQISNSN